MTRKAKSTSGAAGRPVFLSETDCLYLRAEDETRPIHWTCVVELERGETLLTYEEVLSRVRERVEQSDLYRFRLADGEPRRPRFVVAADWHPESHVKAVTLPSRPAVDEWIADVVAEHLPTNRPLWEMALVNQEDEGRQYVALRVHHCITDGLAGVAFVGLLADTVSNTVAEFDRFLSSERFELERPPLRERLRIIAEANKPQRSRPSQRTRPQNTTRSRVVASLSLPTVQLRRHALAYRASTNEFILSAVAAAFNASCAAAGEPRSPLRMQFPVTLDRKLRHTGNAASISIIEMDGMVTDIAGHLERVKDELRRAAESDGAAKVIVAAAPLKYLPWRVQKKLAGKALADICDLSVGVNPGFSTSETVLGRRVTRVMPYVPIVGYPVSVTTLMFRGEFTFGIVANPDDFPGDFHTFVECLHRIVTGSAVGSELTVG
ncbi:wax ester/triacylglycerol synthase domain-containing protein [Nocardia sp. NPDC050793]|uniref:wax ester/triacylglycerol synthase domain-containing protein n=1 Tax=Nocardia sp. NPDC050793 TaxID=3155159 RepID=UPI0033DF4775